MNFLIITMISMAALLLPAGASFAADSALNYSWAAKRVNAALWGMDIGDVDADGTMDVVLIERARLKVGRFDDKGFVEKYACEMVGTAEAARVYLYDLDGDGADEAVVDAVEEGLPAALAFDLSGDGCKILFKRERLSVRVLKNPNNSFEKIFVGQASNSQNYFTGPVRKLLYENGRLKSGDAVEIPRYVSIYQFAILKNSDDSSRIAIVKGYNPLEVHEQRGKKFKRIWRSGGRMGGTVNMLDTIQRPLLDEESADTVQFDVSPLPVKCGADICLIAVAHGMPLKGMIGRRPMVSGAEITEFVPDEALILNELKKTMKLPGAVVDMVTVEQAGKTKLYIMMQENPSMFREGESTGILQFDF